MTLRTEQGDPVHALIELEAGAIVTSKASEQAWQTGTLVEVLAPAPPAFDYAAATNDRAILAALASHESARKAWRGSVIVKGPVPMPTHFDAESLES